MNEKKYYIAYGSNLSVEQMAQRCPDARIVGQAVLEDWELAFHGCATILPNKGKNTPVLVWEISAGDEKNLDIYEGFPHYYRKENMTVEVVSKDAEPMTVTAMVYIMEHDYGQKMPSLYYYRVLHDGYKAFHFPIQSQKRREINTMTYTNIRLFTANGIPEALSNLWYGTDCSVVEIQDAIEDAENAADLLRRIQKMKLLRKVALDRETEQKVRFKTTDCWGNISYLEIRK